MLLLILGRGVQAMAGHTACAPLGRCPYCCFTAASRGCGGAVRALSMCALWGCSACPLRVRLVVLIIAVVLHMCCKLIAQHVLQSPVPLSVTVSTSCSSAVCFSFCLCQALLCSARPCALLLVPSHTAKTQQQLQRCLLWRVSSYADSMLDGTVQHDWRRAHA